MAIGTRAAARSEFVLKLYESGMGRSGPSLGTRVTAKSAKPFGLPENAMPVCNCPDSRAGWSLLCGNSPETTVPVLRTVVYLKKAACRSQVRNRRRTPPSLCLNAGPQIFLFRLSAPIGSFPQVWNLKCYPLSRQIFTIANRNPLSFINF